MEATLAFPSQPIAKAGTCPTLPDFMANVDRIVGGQEAAAPIPWQVSVRHIYDNGGYSRFCGGTILDSKTVVTAAHCMQSDMNTVNGYVMAGNIGWGFGSNNNFKIAQVINHPEYVEATLQNDISILKLAEPLPFGDDIQPMCLPAGDYVPDSGKKCYASGWGRIQGGNLNSQKTIIWLFT